MSVGVRVGMSVGVGVNECVSEVVSPRLGASRSSGQMPRQRKEYGFATFWNVLDSLV